MALLDVNGLEIFYGDLQAVFDMNFTVADGEAVALVGANGAGKSTFLKALVGLNEERRGAVHFDGIDISQVPAEQVSRLGLIMVPEGRLLFDSLTIEENLLVAAEWRGGGGGVLADDTAREVLAAAGLGVAHLVKVTTFLTDRNQHIVAFEECIRFAGQVYRVHVLKHQVIDRLRRNLENNVCVFG